MARIEVKKVDRALNVPRRNAGSREGKRFLDIQRALLNVKRADGEFHRSAAGDLKPGAFGIHVSRFHGDAAVLTGDNAERQCLGVHSGGTACHRISLEVEPGESSGLRCHTKQFFLSVPVDREFRSVRIRDGALEVSGREVSLFRTDLAAVKCHGILFAVPADLYRVSGEAARFAGEAAGVNFRSGERERPGTEAERLIFALPAKREILRVDSAETRAEGALREFHRGFRERELPKVKRYITVVECFEAFSPGVIRLDGERALPLLRQREILQIQCAAGTHRGLFFHQRILGIDLRGRSARDRETGEFRVA